MSEEEELLPESAAISEFQMISLFEKKKDHQYFKEVFPSLPTRWSGENPECIKQQPHIISQKSVTCNTKNSKQQQVEEQKKKKLKHDYYMHRFRTGTFAILLSVGKAHKKPRPINQEMQPLKWQRVKALQCLRCSNKEVVSALYTTLLTDEDCVVKYEAAKALVTLGCWEEEVVLKLIQVMNESTGKLLEDIIITLRMSLYEWANGPIRLRPTIKAKEKLIFLLRSFITTLRSKDLIPVQATACLCYLNRNDEEAIDYIISYLHDGTTYQKKQALEIVLRHLAIHEPFSIQAVLKQLQTSPVYKHRLKALDLLAFVGPLHITETGMHEAVFEALKEKLWDDPVMAVRRRAAIVVNMLKMKMALWMEMEQQLEDNDAEVRGKAVNSLSVLGLPNNRVLQLLLEMVEVDLSQFVRFQIIRAFARLHLNSEHVKRSLLNRQLGEGPLAREAQRALKSLEKTSKNQKEHF
ncbi:protein HEATR9-like isoform X2 [Scyliorhinus torazame]|uniref:protein HEATR9-like isoform X2 n=1 Tax=Scyliorhinus torazame TaxID=75743 RepID=UPI003B5997C2